MFIFLKINEEIIKTIKIKLKTLRKLITNAKIKKKKRRWNNKCKKISKECYNWIIILENW